jgi:hypothetical protein
MMLVRLAAVSSLTKIRAGENGPERQVNEFLMADDGGESYFVTAEWTATRVVLQ